MADIYRIGEGVAIDFKTAAGWYKLAAEQGHRVSQLNLGLMYAFEIGLKKDLSRGYMWVDAAALQGNKDAIKERDSLAGKMSSVELKTGQRLSRECIARNYKKC